MSTVASPPTAALLDALKLILGGVTLANGAGTITIPPICGTIEAQEYDEDAERVAPSLTVAITTAPVPTGESYHIFSVGVAIELVTPGDTQPIQLKTVESNLHRLLFSALHPLASHENNTTTPGQSPLAWLISQVATENELALSVLDIEPKSEKVAPYKDQSGNSSLEATFTAICQFTA